MRSPQLSVLILSKVHFLGCFLYSFPEYTLKCFLECFPELHFLKYFPWCTLEHFLILHMSADGPKVMFMRSYLYRRIISVVLTTLNHTVL